MTPFDRATAVAAAGPARWTVDLDASYGVMGRLNGGYLAAVVARAAAAHLALSEPEKAEARLVQATVRYLTASTEGPASVETALLGASRRVECTIIRTGDVRIGVGAKSPAREWGARRAEAGKPSRLSLVSPCRSGYPAGVPRRDRDRTCLDDRPRFGETGD